MQTLSDDIKSFIVKGLACFDTPTQVAQAVKEKFDLDVSRQHVHSYDPAGANPPAQRWCELHAATRRAFLQETAEIAITHRTYRLRELDRMARFCAERRFHERAAAFMVLAAKECGGFYDRRQPAAAAPNPPPATPAPQSSESALTESPGRSPEHSPEQPTVWRIVDGFADADTPDDHRMVQP